MIGRCGWRAMGLVPLCVLADGADARWAMDGGMLVIELAGDEATIETEVEIAPAANSKLMGLYASGGMLCTQCESEGFRRIAFSPRPARRAVALHGADECRQGALPDPARQRQPGRQRRWR